MKKVLFLIPTLGHGGAERVLVNLANNLDPAKFDVTVQTLFDVGVNRQYLQPHVLYLPGWKHYFRGNSHFFKLFSPRWLYRHLIREEYDILVSYLEGTTARVLSGCTDAGSKIVGWIHIELNTPALAARGFRSPSEAQSCYNRFHRLVAVSNRVRDVFWESLPVSVPLDVLYNTNETEKIREQASDTALDPRFSVGDIPTLCSVAKLIPTKGFDRLLSAHKRLLDEGIVHRVCILGIGEQQRELERKIAELGVQDSFLLLGFQDNPYKYVAKCDLYVCSSRREGFSTAVTEALILGTPVVSTDCSGAKELLGTENEYGLVVENSAEGVYTGMKRMLENPELLAHYRKQAQLRGQFFSREKTVQAVEQMLENL